jgi:hypothetical protein
LDETLFAFGQFINTRTYIQIINDYVIYWNLKMERRKISENEKLILRSKGYGNPSQFSESAGV